MTNKHELIQRFQLEPLLPEGGYFRRIYESPFTNSENRRFAASIFYLLDGDDFSCFHRLDCDEIWHFYSGEQLAVHEITPEGELLTTMMGDPAKYLHAEPFVTVKQGNWFAAEIVNKTGYALVGCTTVPEFQFASFEAAERKELCQAYPQYEELIARLTR